MTGKKSQKKEYQFQLKLTEITFRDLKETKATIEKQTEFLEPELKGKRLADIDKKLQAGEELFTITRIVSNSCLLSEAKKKGIETSDEEAAQFTKQMKTNYKNVDIKNRPDLKEIFALCGGENAYWTDYAPRVYQEKLTLGKLKRDIEQDGKQVWEQYQYDVVNKAELEMKDSSISVSKQDVIDYMKGFQVND